MQEVYNARGGEVDALASRGRLIRRLGAPWVPGRLRADLPAFADVPRQHRDLFRPAHYAGLFKCGHATSPKTIEALLKVG